MAAVLVLACGHAVPAPPSTAANERAGFAGKAVGAEDGRPQALHFESPPGCPLRRDFLDRVGQFSAEPERQRLERRLGALLHRVRVTEREVELWFGSGESRQTALRRVVAQDCSEATSAAALIAAIALRSAPLSEVGTLPDAAEERSDDTAAQVALAPARETDRSPVQPTAAGSTARLPTTTASRGEDAGVESSPQHPVSWVLAAAAGTDRGLGPGFPATVSVGIGRQWGRWAVRLSALHARSSAQPDGRRAEFRAWAASSQVCRRAVGAAGLWQVGACALLRAGALEGSGDDSSDLSISHTESRTIIDPGFALSVVTPSVLGLRVDLKLGAMVPVYRHEFRWESPRLTVYSVPSWAPFARLGVELPAVGVRGD